METEADQTQGLYASLKRLLKTVLVIGQNRVELLLVEAQEERAHSLAILLLAGIVIMLAFTTLSLVVFTVAVLCLRANRFDLLLGLIVVLLLATLGCLWWLRMRLKAWAPFSATLAELKKDKACLDEKN